MTENGNKTGTTPYITMHWAKGNSTHLKIDSGEMEMLEAVDTLPNGSPDWEGATIAEPRGGGDPHMLTSLWTVLGFMSGISPVELARNAYIEALREAGEYHLATLMRQLNARTWTGDDAEPGARTPRYVVDLHGVTFDVAVNADHTVVDINTEEVPPEHGPVVISHGDTLLDDGEG